MIVTDVCGAGVAVGLVERDVVVRVDDVFVFVVVGAGVSVGVGDCVATVGVAVEPLFEPTVIFILSALRRELLVFPMDAVIVCGVSRMYDVLSVFPRMERVPTIPVPRYGLVG